MSASEHLLLAIVDQKNGRGREREKIVGRGEEAEMERGREQSAVEKDTAGQIAALQKTTLDSVVTLTE